MTNAINILTLYPGQANGRTVELFEQHLRD